MADTRRDQIIDFVEKEFIGPDPIEFEGMTQDNGEEILITDPPRTRYIAGILFPKETKDFDIDLKESACETVGDNEKKDEGIEQKIIKTSSSDFLEEAEELINHSNEYKQSAISITVAIKKEDQIRVSVSAGTYKAETKILNDQKHIIYPRVSLEWNHENQVVNLPSSNNRIIKYPVNDSGLQFDITYRYEIGNSVIYTFTLENTKEKKGNSVKDEDCFFQIKFKLFSEKGFSALTEGQKTTEDEDYRSNLLLYRNIHNYAIGHGCAADWEESETVHWISSAIFPKYDIKPIVPNSFKDISLSMLEMSPLGNWDVAIKELHSMCIKYREWINDLHIIRNSLHKEFQGTADIHISNCEKCLSRMENGIQLLKQNDSVKKAFQYMNLSMLMQQLHYNLPLQKWVENEKDDIQLMDCVQIPNVNDSKSWYGDSNKYGKWRPFQIAFILINLHSMLEKECSERNIVDLIWFPTGGGKTEAYLGLSAYTIFIRRIMNNNDNGTAILMRYTLRLLTAQQYERASALICACDLIRKENEPLFGKKRITIGLWVGASTTPNTTKDALKAYKNLYEKGGENPFVILKCPWCGAQMGPVAKKNGKWELPGYKKIPIGHRAFDFEFRCRNNNCHYSKESLPLSVIDEKIYNEPPTLLLGTVDKFAMLPFRPQAQSIFGFKDGKKISSPDLIIQDELHLISGPLGSMVGHYETLINELCTIRTLSGEIHPKIIASTATISRAKSQCHALYGCKREDVFQFPPPGLDAGNSFFAKEDKEQNGRRYVGILSSGSSSDATTAIRLYAALLYAAKAMKVNNKNERDPYWTNIGYYNSIRELGQASTWIRADIDQHLDVMYKRRFEEKKYASLDEYRQARRYIWRDEELTSRISGSEVTSSLSNLGISYPAKTDSTGKVIDHPIDICLATNMISVGLDVPRLGLMTIAGQPKTTSEYIQATSRVGRNGQDAPGLIFVLYRPGKPRDKSHYEHFKLYHSKVYCNVEPTSVTPFSFPVRDRALHAIMVGMMRLENGSEFNQDPPRLPEKKILEKICNIIKKRVDCIDSEELIATQKNMEYFLDCWEDWHPDKWEPGKNSDWSYTNDVPLIYSAGTHPNEAWGNRGKDTPTSMRNVDAECEAFVLENRYNKEED